VRLLKVDSLEEARDKLIQASVCIKPKHIMRPLNEALGMILAEDLKASESVPAFRKSTVDGYAVVAKDTSGASETIPAFLQCIGEVEMGKIAMTPIESGQCVYVPTGGMLPEGANAVVMVEHSEPFGNGQVAIYDSVSPGRSVIDIGDDVVEGAIYMTKGKRLRAQEIGVLASMGVAEVPILSPWRVTILSTGDELIPIEQKLMPGEIRDSNSYTAAAQCRKHGLEVVAQLILPDDEEAIRNAILAAKGNSDLLIISGGSSQGKKDMTAVLLDELSSPGVFTHGIAVKPGKPTILAVDEISKTLMIGLPGHPVAAMVIFELLVGWLWRRVAGSPEPLTIPATLDINVAGGSGRAMCLLLELSAGVNGWIATPILGNSGLLSTLTHADGYTMLGLNQEGLNRGETVQVTLF
jgi:molybdopterin molybdotransferase